MALLSHLYTRIRGSQEDIATLSLQYIISRSDAKELENEFTRIMLSTLKYHGNKSLHYICQATGENKERPDLAGIDDSGKECILCEAKFYAGLTENQPVAYLKRLKEENGIGLVFICPSVRKRGLWTQLLNLCQDLELTEADQYFIKVDGIPMSILTWNEILEALIRADASAKTGMSSDLEQLDDYCKTMDSTAFIPFSTEDFGVDVPRREARYYTVIDRLCNELEANTSIKASTKGTRVTPNLRGYVRYIRVNQYSLTLAYDRDLWMNPNCAETPFWLVITAGNWHQPSEYFKVFNRYPDYEMQDANGVRYLALHALTDSILEDVVNDLMGQVLKHIHDLDEYVKNNSVTI